MSADMANIRIIARTPRNFAYKAFSEAGHIFYRLGRKMRHNANLTGI